MDRAPGLSVRLKLTLSYAGFLMLAGALTARGGVGVPPALRAGASVPRQRGHAHVMIVSRSGAASCAFSLRGRPPSWRSCWCSVLWEGGCSPAACSPRSTRITDATRMAATGSLSHRIRLPGRRDEFRELADAFDTMLARLEAHVAEQQRFAANASHELRTPLAITQTLLEVARNDPNRDTGELIDRLQAVNTRAIDLTEALLLLSRADQRSFTREDVDLSLIAEEATETLLPFAENRGVTIETSGDLTPTIGSHALLLQMTTNLVHNAIVHNLPEQGTVWVTTSAHPENVVLTVENTGETAHPAAGFHACRAVSSRHRTHLHRPRRCRPRPGNRREHHQGTRRNSHPHPAGRRRALRHRATPRGATLRMSTEWPRGAMTDRTRITPAYRAVRIASTPSVLWSGRLHVTGLERCRFRGPCCSWATTTATGTPWRRGSRRWPRRQIRALAKSRCGRTRSVARPDRDGQIPIERGSGDSGALDRATRSPKGACIGIYPEGTRSLGRALRARSGIGYLARAVPEATIIGVACNGTIALPRFPAYARACESHSSSSINPRSRPTSHRSSTDLADRPDPSARADRRRRPKRAAALAGRVPHLVPELDHAKPRRSALDESPAQIAASRTTSVRRSLADDGVECGECVAVEALGHVRSHQLQRPLGGCSAGRYGRSAVSAA